MGHLQNGVWVTDETLTEDQGGRYVKQPSLFRNWITADSTGEFPAEPGRYHLYSAVGCPWAHRAALFGQVHYAETAFANLLKQLVVADLTVRILIG